MIGGCHHYLPKRAISGIYEQEGLTGRIVYIRLKKGDKATWRPTDPNKAIIGSNSGDGQCCIRFTSHFGCVADVHISVSHSYSEHNINFKMGP